VGDSFHLVKCGAKPFQGADFCGEPALYRTATRTGLPEARKLFHRRCTVSNAGALKGLRPIAGNPRRPYRQPKKREEPMDRRNCLGIVAPVLPIILYIDLSMDTPSFSPKPYKGPFHA
jgi:hypothetical protein